MKIRTIKIFKEVMLNGLKGIRMTFFSTRKDRFGYLDKSSSVTVPYWGVIQNVYIHESSGINAFAKFICYRGKFI